MTVYVDATGFHRPTFSEIRKQQESIIQIAFGSAADLAPTGPLGQLVAAQTTWASDLFDVAQETHTVQDRDQATGVFLDEACSKIGVLRLPATSARVDDVLLWGPYGVAVTVPLGSQVKNANQAPVYALESDVVLGTSTGPFRALRASAVYSTSDTLSITLDGVAYTRVCAGSTVAELTALASTINGGAFTGSASVETITGTNYLRIEGDGFSTSAHSVHFTMYQGAIAGVFVAVVAESRTVPALTLDTILTPVSGWASIEQPAAGLAGTDVETDAALRVRSEQGIRSGTGTEDAIREALYRVPGVSMAVVESNTGDVVDSEGRPAHSVESLVIGGSNADVAYSIWTTKPAGIEPYGTSTLSVLGKDGKMHDVGYSRPDPQYAWVKVLGITVDSDYTALAAGYQAAIAQAIEEYGNANFGLGSNFLLKKMYTPVLSVPSVGDAVVTIAITATEGGSPSYGAANLPISFREYLSFSASRVVFA